MATKTSACGTWPTELPAGAVGEPIGNPVRQAVLDRAAAPYIPPGDYPMDLLVIGGSQGARVLSDVVPAALGALPGDLQALLRVAHQARVEDHERVVAAYAGTKIKADVDPESLLVHRNPSCPSEGSRPAANPKFVPPWNGSMLNCPPAASTSLRCSYFFAYEAIS